MAFLGGRCESHVCGYQNKHKWECSGLWINFEWDLNGLSMKSGGHDLIDGFSWWNELLSMNSSNFKSITLLQLNLSNKPVTLFWNSFSPMKLTSFPTASRNIFLFHIWLLIGVALLYPRECWYGWVRQNDSSYAKYSSRVWRWSSRISWMSIYD